jgi:hypothetical protein
MRLKHCSVLALLALLAVPAAAFTDETRDQGGVSYVEAMECGAVFTFLSSTSEGSTAAEYEERGAKWLVIAMRRDGTPDGRLAEAEFIPMVEDLVETLEQAPDPNAGDRFLDDMIGFCETKEQVIADEFNRIRV